MDIATIVRSLGTLSLINFSRLHADRLQASKVAPVAARAPVIRQVIDELQLAYSARRPLRALWVNATEKKDAADDALDTTVRTLSYDLLAPSALSGDRNSVQYRALFPDGTIGFITGPDRVELAQVAGMVAYLEANTGHPMTSRAADLKAKAMALDVALEPQTNAEQLFHAAQATEREKREALARALRKSVTFLRDQFDGDEKKVDALFPTIAEARVKEDPGEEVATTPASAPAPVPPAKS